MQRIHHVVNGLDGEAEDLLSEAFQRKGNLDGLINYDPLDLKDASLNAVVNILGKVLEIAPPATQSRT